MKLIIFLLSGTLTGFGAHRAYKPSLNFGDRWGTILRYGIGGMLVLPFLLMFADLLIKKDEKTTIQEILLQIGISYLVAVGALGSGVVAGHLVDRMSEAE